MPTHITTTTPIASNKWRGIAIGMALACSVGAIAMSAPDSHAPGIPALRTGVGDCFAPNSQPNKKTSAPLGIQNWVSWKKQDGGTGKLVLGPFASPETITLAVVGYPNKAGNRLYVENMRSAEIQEINDTGTEEWHELTVVLPTSWVGEQIQLVAIDGATGGFGWLGISEPHDPNRRIHGTRLTAWARSLRAFGVLWLLLVGSWVIALQLPMCRALDEHARPMAGLAVVFLCGYVSFWLYLLHPLVGYASSVAIAAVAAVGWLLIIRQCHGRPTMDSVGPMAFLGLLGLFSVSLFTVTDVPMLLPELAQFRFTPGLPVDNSLPGLFADRLYAGQSPKQLIGDWLSSDRPPLQTGWVLLTRPVCDWLSIDHDASTYIAGVIAQLAWVPATWWAVRWLGLSAGVAGFLCAMFATTGFFIQNTVFVWPKLLSASMAIGAALLLLEDEDHPTRREVRWSWAAGFAALATLAHGGAWFSNLALIPFFLARQPWRSLRTTCVACGIAASLVLPWMAYQKLYEPPGDRLLKWHLAGQTRPDQRRLSAVMAEAYGKKSLADLVDARSKNLTMQFRGNYGTLVDSRTESMLSRRGDEFKYSLRALGWWNLGWFLYPFAMYLASKSNSFAPFLRRWNRLTLWSAATFAVWIGLLFLPSTATIHHGSYALEAMLFVLPAAMLAATSPGLLVATSVLAVVVFMSTWAPVAPWLTGAGYAAPAVLLALASWLVAVGLSKPCLSTPCCGPDNLPASQGTET